MIDKNFVDSWKSGHKNTCAAWKKAYNGIVKAQKTVGRIHAKEGANIEGLPLNIIVDYTIASGTSFSNWDFHVITTDDGIHLDVPEGPSMKHFYENLGRMVRREWWIYPTTVSLEEYNRKAQDHEPDDSFFSNFVCFVLAHDIVGFVEESSKETGIEADVLLALVLKNSPVVCPEKHEMPIERFIELYNSYVALCDLSNCNANRYRSDMKSMAIQVLRKKWPK